MITAHFGNEQQIHRLLLLVHRDLARVEGNVVLAQRKLDSQNDPNMKSLPGGVRRKAVQTIESSPEHIAILEGAQRALQEALAVARERGLVG